MTHKKEYRIQLNMKSYPIDVEDWLVGIDEEIFVDAIHDTAAKIVQNALGMILHRTKVELPYVWSEITGVTDPLTIRLVFPLNEGEELQPSYHFSLRDLLKNEFEFLIAPEALEEFKTALLELVDQTETLINREPL